VKFLVDADVLSEPTKPRPAAHVIDWLRQHNQDLALSPIVLGELEYGILLLPSGRKRSRLMNWFTTGVNRFSVLAFDGGAARAWATLLAELKQKGRAMPVKDSLIAASARQHNLTIATRNVADYRYAGVAVVDPFNER
jgi:predicted nucleic acid-binding protein